MTPSRLAERLVASIDEGYSSATYQLQRALRYDPIRAYRRRRRDELAVISGAVVLLNSAVIAYSTLKLDDRLLARRRTGNTPPSFEVLP